MLGYNLKGNPKEPLATVIDQANLSSTPIISVDVPSGLNSDTGQASVPTIKAEATLTLALPQTGLYQQRAKEFTGKLFLADISVPKQVYQKLGIEIPLLFENSEVIPLKV